MTPNEIYLKTLEYNLDWTHNIPPSEAIRIYNGVGPEFLNSDLRKVLDKISKELLPAVMIHDVDFTYGDGTLEDFHRANLSLKMNGIKCANFVYPWYHYKRYLIRAQAKAYAKLCDTIGLPAYEGAIKTRQRYEKQ